MTTQEKIREADQKAVEAQLSGDQTAFAEWRTIGEELRNIAAREHLRRRNPNPRDYDSD